MELHPHYFLKGHARSPDPETIPTPRANEVVVFENLFSTGLRMLPHLVLADILQKFCVQLHQLTLNAIVRIRKFIWAVSSCGSRSSCRSRPAAEVFAKFKQKYFILTPKCHSKLFTKLSKSISQNFILVNVLLYFILKPLFKFLCSKCTQVHFLAFLKSLQFSRNFWEFFPINSATKIFLLLF
jgi:hypothetical protein